MRRAAVVALVALLAVVAPVAGALAAGAAADAGAAPALDDRAGADGTGPAAAAGDDRPPADRAGAPAAVRAPAGGGTAAAQAARVSITNVAVEPSTPAPGEDVVITPTVTVLESSPAAFDLTDVALRTPAGERLAEFARVEDLGTLAPGTELSVPMVVSFDEPGLHRFRVHAYGHSGSRNVHVQYPVVVNVEADRDRPQIDVDVARPVAGAETTANVTVSNGLDDDVRNLELELGGDGLAVDRPRRVRPALASGESETFRYSLTAREPGVRSLDATLRYSRGGEGRTTTQRAEVRFRPLRDRVLVNATVVDGGQAVAVDVTNLGNVPVEGVLVRERSDDATASPRLLGRVPTDESRQVRLNVTATGSGDGAVDVPISVDYEVGNLTRSTETSVSLPTDVGAVELTGIDIVQENGRLRISGSVSNVGTTAVESVLVRLRPQDGVQPARPNKEYFVGTVPESDFRPFDVYAVVTREEVGNLELAVTYRTDAGRQKDVVLVEYTGGPSIETGERGGLADLLPVVLTTIVVGALGGLVLRGWRNRHVER